MNKAGILLVTLAVFCWLSPVWAADHTNDAVHAAEQNAAHQSGDVLQRTAPQWAQLNQAQQKTLGSLATTWDQLSDERRNAILRGLAHWQAMNAEQRRRTRQRFGKWQTLPEAERSELRSQFRSFQQMPAATKQRLRQQFRRFKALPVEQQKRLRERFKRQHAQEGRAGAKDKAKQHNELPQVKRAEKPVSGESSKPPSARAETRHNDKADGRPAADEPAANDDRQSGTHNNNSGHGGGHGGGRNEGGRGGGHGGGGKR